MPHTSVQEHERKHLPLFAIHPYAKLLADGREQAATVVPTAGMKLQAPAPCVQVNLPYRSSVPVDARILHKYQRHTALLLVYVVCCLGRCLSRADGKGVSWDLPAVVQGSNFFGGALGENLRPMEVDNFYTW